MDFRNQLSILKNPIQTPHIMTVMLNTESRILIIFAQSLLFKKGVAHNSKMQGLATLKLCSA